jgi:hypothetical protein
LMRLKAGSAYPQARSTASPKSAMLLKNAN